MTDLQKSYLGSSILRRISVIPVKLFYYVFFRVMIRDESWQEALVASLSPKANNSILDFGPGSSSTVIALALRFPEATFVGADPDPKAVAKAKRHITRNLIRNVTVIEASLPTPLPFNAGSFDKVVCLLTFHNRSPGDKLGLAKELIRVLRRGGALHLAEYDRAEKSGEDRILRVARYVFGASAADSHLNGKWTEFLAKAGFSSIRRLSSDTVGIGRISVVKAYKR